MEKRRETDSARGTPPARFEFRGETCFSVSGYALGPARSVRGDIREGLDLPLVRPAQIEGARRHPGLLALWLGPVVWFGIAGFEELWRVHLLRRLWRVLPGKAGQWAVIQ